MNEGMKLTSNDVALIVQWLAANGWSDGDIANRFNVTKSWIGKLRRRNVSQ